VIGVVLVWSLAALILLAARWIDPPSTAVHIQRRLQAWIHHTPYHERYKFIPLSQISPDHQHAVVAAEDARFPGFNLVRDQSVINFDRLR
jgi:monofunctional biosynthetic peptidoglycan transglycosylase